MTVQEDYPEWKHTLLVWFAKLLFISNVKYVILVSDIQDDRKTEND